MSKLKHIINGTIWTVAIVYFILITAVHVPIVQSWIGEKVSSALEDRLGTRINVSRIDLGFLNRVIIDGVDIYDQKGHKMLSASRLAAKINYYELLRNGRIFISSAQLFGMNGSFYRDDSLSKPNYQFLLDSLSSKDKTKKSSIELSINSLIIRHGSFTYDRNDIAPASKRFDMAHIDVRDISAHFVIPYYSKDSLVAEVKKMSLNEQSGLSLNNLTFKIEAGQNGINVEDFELKLPQTALRLNKLNAKYSLRNGAFEKESLQYDGNIGTSSVTLADFAAIVPSFRNADIPISISASFNGTGSSLKVKQLSLLSKDNEFSLAVNGYLEKQSELHWMAIIKELKCNTCFIEHMFVANDGSFKLPEFAHNFGTFDYNGTLEGQGKNIVAKGTLATEAGAANLKVEKNRDKIAANISSQGIDIRKLTKDEHLGVVSADIKGDVIIKNGGKQLSGINVDGIVNRFDYNGYSYKNIMVKGQYDKETLNGLVSIDDPNGFVRVEGTANTGMKSRNADISATIRGFDPAMLRLSNKWQGSKFDLDLNAQIDLSEDNMPVGNISVRNFSMTSEEDTYHINRIDLVAEKSYLAIDGDFGKVDLSGRYDMKTLPLSFLSQLHSKLPTLFVADKQADNNYVIDAEINSLEVLNRLFNIPVKLHSPLKLKAAVNDMANRILVDCSTKDFSYNGGHYENVQLKATSPADTLYASVSADKVMDNGHKLGISLNTAAADDNLLTTIKWNNYLRHPVKGILNTETAFTKGRGKGFDICTTVRPSEVMVSDTVWHVLPAKIKYSEDNLSIDNFAIEHNRQHIRIDGFATRSANDSIVVDLQDVDVSYILNLVNFHAVDFSGFASGKAYVKSVFFAPDVYADLTVRDFRFENGRLGDLKAHANWNKKEKQIDVDACAKDKKGGMTLINGFVSPTNNKIDLAIEAKQSNLEFLESFCGSFLGDITARGKGTVRIVGPLNRINLTGMIVADGSALVKPLNVEYSLYNDTVRFIPDNIIFSADTIRDRNGNIGIVSGALHHEHLTHLTYGLQINAEHLLCYDTHSYGDDVFFGTAYGTGLCSIQGGNGRIDIDVDIKPEKGSFIEYNAASPETISTQEYITWHDATPPTLPSPTDSLTIDSLSHNRDAALAETQQNKNISIPSDLRINFTLDVTPEATLRVLMDRASGDFIALNGTGSIRATYFNKGTFDMFGNYLIDHGLYKLTIQNVIKKEFQFQQGSTIVFGGDPYNAALNLKALYTVNGVPLSDLRLGRSFSSNNVRVDCLMNITGTPQSPKVDFDLDMPTVNSDAKQMVKTVINGEEEMNQQVVYLLSVGRFYIQNNNDATNESSQPSQTSLAMQSLLSGTISQQINSLLGSLVKNNNWSFGANISTGDEGFNNAEYEGLLQGHLLNNRLIINGQFGYRDNANATTSFIGDFDISYLLFPSGNLAIKVYNQTNDRYFTKSSLNTQGIGLMMKKDFNNLWDLFGINRKQKQEKP